LRSAVTLTEKKTGKRKIILVNATLKKILKAYLPLAECGKPLILNTQTGKALSRQQAYRIIRAAAEAVGIEQKVGCHSCRKTFGYHAWRRGVSPVVIMEIYNHSSFAITKRYLGVSQDDQNEVYRKMRY
jgi:site-specific recombinase XerD